MTGVLHATSVGLGPERAVLILGKSGSGKSALALQLMALGATLVADDRVVLSVSQGHLVATAPQTIHGQIEARGIGVLTVPAMAQARVTLAVDLDHAATQRVPDPRKAVFHDVAIPLISAVQRDYFAPAILSLLRHS